MLVFFFIVSSGVYGQNQKLADSIELVYLEGNFNEQDRLKILKELAINHLDPEKKLIFSIELIETATTLDSIHYMFSGYLQKGNALMRKGDLSKALESYVEATKFAKDEKTDKDLGKIYIAIGDVYSQMGDFNTAIRFYHNALKIHKNTKNKKDSIAYATGLENLGDLYNLDLAKPDSALIFFNESGAIFTALKSKSELAYNLGNKGLAYAQQGKDIMAEENITKAIEMLTELGDYYPICVYLTYMSDMYVMRNDYQAAFKYAHESLELARQYGLKEQISDANLKLSELYEKTGDAISSLKFYKDHIIYKDSVKNIASIQQMANIRTDLEIAQKQIEVDLLNQQKRNKNILVFTMIFVLGWTAYFYRKIVGEKKKSENLLLNILPTGTAKELKETGKVQAKKFDAITVLFADFQAFTRYSQELSPRALVKTVDYYFSNFDKIIEKHGLEKIKTIGDCYMCAGGLPFETNDHSLKVVYAAFDIAQFMEKAKNLNEEDIAHFDVRIGINTGPVVAGVVGIKKFAYDIWGDTVNVASRMETNSQAGKINVSENTYQLIKDTFDCEFRGEIDVKNKGMMKMYFVNGLKDTAVLNFRSETTYHN
ncbi:MAG: tetratricopeptide repeat protein [Flavobacteriaceae bacterium]|nr:tetratricopeptide repeat protein [Flavobacteriaceae bacterium]